MAWQSAVATSRGEPGRQRVCDTQQCAEHRCVLFFFRELEWSGRALLPQVVENPDGSVYVTRNSAQNTGACTYFIYKYKSYYI